jgi:type VII secretion protein EccE
VRGRRRSGRGPEQPLTSAPLSATAAILPQRVVPLADLLVVQSFVAAGMTAELLLDGPGWYGAAAGLGVALVFVVRIRGLPMPRWVSERLAFWYERRRRTHSTASFAPFDAELSDGSQIGFHWDGKTLMSLVRILENPQAMTVMEPAMTVSGQTVSVQILAECLQQFDITLDSIDVISHGVRSQHRSQLGSIYEAVLGPLPAVAQRSVWLALRLDPTLCPDAVRHRGGGWEGITRTAATATRRVVNRLSDAGLRAQIMTATEIAQATDHLLNGMGLSTLNETWLACQAGPSRMHSFFVKPSMFSTANLGLLWTVPSDSTAVCVSLRRDERNNLIKLRGLVRFDSHGQIRVKLRDLGQLPGRQYAALISSLPVPSPRRSVAGWVFARGVDAVEDLELPVSGCGQLVGADEHGRAVALPLFGPQVQRVDMCGTLQLAQQVVLRSLALGAEVRVQTRRPAAWRTLVEQVGDDNLLSVNDRNGDSMQIGTDRGYPGEMFDGAPERTVQQGVTTMVVKPSHAEPAHDADVTLQLLDHNHDLVRVGTRSATAVVTMVASADEMRYIRSSLGIVD